jgi:hypothetical protein
LKEVTWLDYSAGGVPTGQFFKMTLDDLRKIIKSSQDRIGINRLNEICFIGLVSYFEAFCKDLFASIINIIPDFVENLKDAGQDVLVDSTRILLYRDEISHKIGFLVAEKYDFGSAQKINALYKALLNVSPFSKDDIKKYGDILRDRNLFVHHGGTYTLTYLQQSKLIDEESRDRAFFDSLVIDKAYMNDKLDFVEQIARKMSKATHEAVNQLISEKSILVSDEQKKAIDAFLWWD